MKKSVPWTILSIIVCLSLTTPALCQDMTTVKLPEPELELDVTLMQALKDRKTSREFGPGDLSPQKLSNLLWAAWGINRPDSGRRTAPSALNRQEIDLYVTSAHGVYLYDAKTHSLIPAATGDIRALTGKQSYFRDAAINIVFVADLTRMDGADEAHKLLLASMGAGFIAQNIYLYCAAEALPTVYRVSIDKPRLADAMKLRNEQRIMAAQTVGLPKKNQ